MFGKVKFSECPMYHKSKHNGIKFNDLDIEIKNVQKTVNNIEIEHRINLQSTESMKEKIDKLDEALMAHMEDETQHHINTSRAIDSLASSVESLIGNQEQHRVFREEKERKTEMEAEKWKVWWMKIASTIISVIIIGIGTIVYGTWKYGNELQHTKSIQQAILTNQENHLINRSK